MNLLVLETLARGIAIGALVATGAGLWRGGGAGSVRLAGALFCAGVIAYAINSSPPLRHAAGWALPALHFASLGGVGLFWLLIVTLFEDRPITPRTLAPWALLTLVGLMGIAGSTAGPSAVWFVIRPRIWVVHNLIEAAFALHALYIIARSWRGDLVEARRRLRGPFLTMVTLYVITLSGFEIAEDFGHFKPWLRLLGGVSLALYCVVGAMVFLQARPELFGAAAPATAAPATGLDAGDRASLDKLAALMGEGEAWRREGLSIGVLADEVGVPEHRLRRLINDQLGYRNFAAFVNARRIAAAKRLLADAQTARQTVAAIAYDLGFGSLGPFNRAFKEATGVTPTEWRRRASPIRENPG